MKTIVLPNDFLRVILAYLDAHADALDPAAFERSRHLAEGGEARLRNWLKAKGKLEGARPFITKDAHQIEFDDGEEEVIDALIDIIRNIWGQLASIESAVRIRTERDEPALLRALRGGPFALSELEGRAAAAAG